MHIGDLLWGMRMRTQKNPERDHRIWFDASGAVMGFARLYPPADLMMQVTPDLRGAGVLEDAMLAWALDERARHTSPGAAPAPITTAAAASDAETLAWFARRGFVPDGHDYVILTRDLAEPVETAALADGAVARPVSGEGEFGERVSIHREVWEPSRVTLDGYRLTRSAPGYDPDLDLSVVLPNGSFAAYCICWLDAVNRVGEFEPVGTRPSQRRKGYGRALLLDGMRRMRERGMRQALVYCEAHNVPFYESAGFGAADRYVGFSALIA
jgi:GNAT superfamily N-acetyltransferase